ncbi:MAG: FAD-dependent oxidoreductase, partial [Thermomicrobiales bacterium]
MAHRFDLIVVGAGAVGAYHALHAARAGLSVALLDRHDWPAGASIRNFGMAIPSGMAPGHWLDLARESAAIYRELAAAGAATITGTGTLYLATTDLETRVLSEFAARGPALGYRCVLLDPADARAFHPALTTGDTRAALHFPDDLQIDQRNLFRTLIPWMVETLGVTWLPGRDVTAISRRQRATEISTTTGERFTGARAVICPGPDLVNSCPALAAEAGITTCKLQMLRT